MSYNENGLVAIARSCRQLERLRHPLPPLHFDSDERLHRSSLRLVCKSNGGLRNLDFSLPPRGEEVMVHRLVDALNHAPALAVLSVRNCCNVDDRIAKPLVTGGRLRHLDVRGTSVSYACLNGLARTLTNLVKIIADAPAVADGAPEVSEELRRVLVCERMPAEKGMSG